MRCVVRSAMEHGRARGGRAERGAVQPILQSGWAEAALASPARDDAMQRRSERGVWHGTKCTGRPGARGLVLTEGVLVVTDRAVVRRSRERGRTRQSPELARLGMRKGRRLGASEKAAR